MSSQRLKRGLLAVADNLLRETGYELRRARRRDVTVEKFSPVTNAVYHHGDPVFEVPVEACCYPYVFSYALSGWHPFVATLQEVSENPSIGYSDSTLYRYYSHFQPRNVRDLLFEPGSDGSGAERLEEYSLEDFLPLLPWDPKAFRARGEKGLGARAGNQGYGPVSDEKGELEFRRLARVFDSIAQTGYRPSEHGHGEIRGYFLKTPDDYRFVIRSGLHRTAVLAVLGYETIQVGFYPGFPRAIHVADVCSWPLVRSGIYTAAAAARYLERFFAEDGRLKAERLGVLSVDVL